MNAILTKESIAILRKSDILVFTVINGEDSIWSTIKTNHHGQEIGIRNDVACKWSLSDYGGQASQLKANYSIDARYVELFAKQDLAIVTALRALKVGDIIRLVLIRDVYGVTSDRKYRRSDGIIDDTMKMQILRTDKKGHINPVAEYNLKTDSRKLKDARYRLATYGNNEPVWD